MIECLETQRETDYLLLLESQRDKLIETMESEFGLPEKLLKMRTLSHRQVEKIRYAVTREEKNELILDFIMENGKHQDLIKALSESFQTHLVNYINSNGVYRSEYGLDWPLSEREHEILNDNEEQLTDVLDTCELFPKLYSKQVINAKQRNFIHSRTSDQAQNEALLGMIRRLSRASYLTLIECLKESHQTHIADILENGGALVPVHATLETDNLDETETQIVDEVTQLLLQRNVSAQQANRVLSAAQLNIIAVKRGQSIVIYICCSTGDELDRVCKMIDNSTMKNFLQQLFDLLTHNIHFKVLSVKIYESDVKRARQIFKTIRAEVPISQWTPTTIDDLPLEVIDLIIQKSFAIFIQMKSQTDDEKDQEGFKQLAEVNVCWFKRMAKRRFKNDRWSYLSGIYEKKNSISIFWRNNRQFIEENVIRLRTGAIKSKNQDLLSDIERALFVKKYSTLKKQKPTHKANEVAIVLSIINERKLKLFNEYLRLPGWMDYAMRDCGTSVRVEINSRRPIEDEKITRFFEDSGSESLGSMKDRDSVRWIWRKSSDSKELQQSKYLRHPFCHLVEESPQRIEKMRITVSSDQLKRKASVLPHKFDDSLTTIDEYLKAVGVTKLKNEVYCLNSRGKIRVFCDRYPFVLLRKVQMREIENAHDIVSCEKENALYILDIYRSLHVCVWKFEQNSKTNQNQMKWLEISDEFRPSNLSMSKSDGLLMISRKPSPCLRMYGSDAQLRLSIALHQSIQCPIHAVETTTGNFVILHLQNKKDEATITTLSRDGKTVVHNYQPKNEEHKLIGCYVVGSNAGYLSIDSHDRVFVADSYNNRAVLLDSNLRWKQILFPKNEGKEEESRKKIRVYPHQLCYDEGKKQLVVYGFKGVEIVFLNKF